MLHPPSSRPQNNRLIKICFAGGWLQFLLCLSIITFLSLTPDPGSAFELTSDKVLHVLGWLCMSISLSLPWFIAFFLKQQHSFYKFKKYFVTAILLFVYSIVIEVAQQYTGRQFSGLDIVANAVGVLVGSFFVLIIKIKFQNKNRRVK